MTARLDALLTRQEAALSAAAAAHTDAQTQLDALQQTLGKAEQAEALRRQLETKQGAAQSKPTLNRPRPAGRGPSSTRWTRSWPGRRRSWPPSATRETQNALLTAQSSSWPSGRRRSPPSPTA